MVDTIEKFICKMLKFDYVQKIYGFDKKNSYELWVIVDEQTMENYREICRKIYSKSLDLDDVDVIICEDGQIDYSEMPPWNKIWRKDKNDEIKLY